MRFSSSDIMATCRSASCCNTHSFLFVAVAFSEGVQGKNHVLGGSLPSDKGFTFERQRVSCVNVKQDAYRLTQSFLY